MTDVPTGSGSAREGSLQSPSMVVPRLEDLIPTDTLAELVASFQSTSSLRVWIRSKEGTDLVGPIDAAKLAAIKLEDGDTVHLPDAGGMFVTANLEIDHDLLGRIAVGPFLISGDAASVPVMTVERARAQLDHLRLTLDLILHARLRASYSAAMHLASIEESFAELLRKNAALEEALARLQELDRLKSGFLATISHELRTPLTSIIGYSEMLVEGMCGPLTKEQLEFVQTIRQKGDELLRLILSLLDLSKLESGTLKMHPIPVPIEAILADAISTVSPSAARKGVRVTLEPAPPIPYLRADPDRLRQVFVNLVDNAVKFTPKGGAVSLTAQVVEAATADELPGLVLMAPIQREIEIRIGDTGVGIPAHERQRIFDPFYQVDQSSTREQGGAGLGLAIVKRIVEAHSGRIRVDDNAPRGSVFIVSLPLKGSGSSGTRPRISERSAP